MSHEIFNSIKVNDATTILISVVGGSTIIKARGTGSPEGIVTANVGSEYTDTSNGILYAKTSGSGNTGWTTVGGGGSGVTNLTATASPTGVVVASDTGTDATIPLATEVNAGLLPPGIIHSSSPSSTLPATATRVGEIFIRSGATAPGLYVALDLVGNWSGPLG